MLRVTVDGSKSYQIDDRCIVGREDGCTIVLTDPHVSRKHAAIQRAPDGTHILVDLNSSRGTFLDGERIVAAIVQPGSTARIGQTVLTFEGTVSRKPGRASNGEDSYDLKRDYDHLRAAYELNRAIGVEQDPDKMMARILEAAFDLLPAERAAIVLIDPASSRPIKQVSRSRDRSDEEVLVSRTLLAEVVRSKAGVISADAGADKRFSRSESICDDGVRSAMCVPLLYQEEVMGVMHCDSLHAINAFKKIDLELFSSIAAQAALVLKKLQLRSRVQTMVEEERDRLERILRELPAGVLLFDAGHRLVRSNSTGDSLLAALGERSIGELIGRAKEGPFEIEIGDPNRILLISAGEIDGAERQHLMTIQDVTRERMRERMAVHADRLALVGQLAGGIAHDFNNLLSIIVNVGQLLKEELEGNALQEDVGAILGAAKRGAQLCKKLGVFSRSDGSTTKVLDANAVIREMQPLLKSVVHGRATVEMELSPKPQMIAIGEVGLEQILMNLVANARDAVSEENGLIRLETMEAEVDKKRWLELVVSDNGCGMEPSVAARIFEPFFTTKDAGQGTGLGLATVWGLVTGAGGTIRVDSKPGAGARFHIRLPHAESAERSLPNQRQVRQSTMR